MNYRASLLVALGIVLVGFPTGPCELLLGTCHAAPVTPAAQPPARHSCCDDSHAKPSHSPKKTPAGCDRECCRLKAVAPTADKVAAEPLSAAPVAAITVPSTSAATSSTVSTVVLPTGSSLLSLHCLLRC